MPLLIDLAVPGEELLGRMAAAQRPLGFRSADTSYALLRETYFDTGDFTLRRAGLRLCLCLEATGRRTLELELSRGSPAPGIADVEVLSQEIEGNGLYQALAGDSDPAIRVREVVDPVALRPILALDIDRESRPLRGGRFSRPTLVAHFDRITAHRGGDSRPLQRLVVRGVEPASGPDPATPTALDALVRRLADECGTTPDGADGVLRAWEAFDTVPRRSPGAGPSEDGGTVLILIREGAVALVDGPDGLGFPTGPGAGEAAARAVAARLGLGAPGPGEPERIGFLPVPPPGQAGEVWLVGSEAGSGPEGVLWIPTAELMERVGAPRLRGRSLVTPLLLLARSEAGQRLLWRPGRVLARPTVIPPAPRCDGPPGSDPEDQLLAELSTLDFHQRVLEMAEDASLPLLERFRFLAIFAANVDEFFVVRVARMKADQASSGGASEGEVEGSAAATLLDLVAVRTRALQARQYACLHEALLPGLAAAGTRIRSWAELDAGARASLGRRFESETFPLLTPRAMSSAPGHPFPRMESLGLSLAVVLRGSSEEIAHLAHVRVPSALPRFLRVPDGHDLVPVEEVIAAHAASLFPAYGIAEIHPFRISRAGSVEVNELTSASLLASIEDEIEARPYKPVVRLEIHRSMPREVLAYILRELRQEAGVESSALGRADVFEVDGPLDLASFAAPHALGVEGGSYPPFEPRPAPLGPGSVFERVSRGDVLVYHPYESFEDSVVRFVREAAEDRDVVAIKLTLYRTGRDSVFADSLLTALRNGKEVAVFVELKARFDEEANVQWTRRLIEAGGHVVYGVVGYKTHAKTTLVVRREGDVLRRYVHVGTGNYNAATARYYTDFGLLSARPDLGADLNDFFNELTGSAGPPGKQYRRLLVAPSTLGPGLAAHIQREVAHARAGRNARIRAKLNGLTDRATIMALYEAGRAGVRVELLVRSMCMLRPGVPGLSETITVRSLLGRFLEHGRIYWFDNGGDEVCYLASADWRRRNLRKRVEVAVPVDDPGARARLGRILDAEMEDPRAWVLRPDGAWERRDAGGPTTQERALAGEL